MPKPVIWTTLPTPEGLNFRGKNTLSSYLGIVFTAVENRSLTAQMPIDARTLQPLGRMHGGASAALAETVASAAANYCIDLQKEICVGLELNINHLRSVTKGTATAIASPLHLGRSTQVWDVKIYNEERQLTAVARLTLAVLKKKNPRSDRGGPEV